jgi:pimeloyl-ACP methyl ester carboxylesterase
MKSHFERKIIGGILIIVLVLLSNAAVAEESDAQSQRPILGHTVIGQGPEKVIALHNFWEDQREYWPLIPYLNKNSNTYAFADVRGYYNSRNIFGMYTAEEAAGDVIALADYLGWDRFHLVGHSKSGMIAQRVAIDAINRVKSIVALTPVPAKGLGLSQQMTDGISRFVASKRALKGYYASKLSMYTKQYAMFHANRSWNNATSEVRMGYLKMWNNENFASEAKGLKTPIRVVLGSLDKNFNSLVAPFWETFYPNCEIVTCENATHFVTEETPLCAITAIDTFIEKHTK